MKFEITGLEKKEENKLNDDGTIKGSKGGTEYIKNKINELVPNHYFDKIKLIHSRVRDNMFEKDKKTVLLLHDTFDDPEVQHLRDPKSRERFSKLVFVSNHQFNTYRLAHGVQHSEAVVIKNAIDPIQVGEKPDDKIKLVYHTTPHRGLELLVPAFEAVYEKYKDKISLDVFSSFDIYGWGKRNEPYEPLYEKCRQHPGINYHGYADNEVVRQALAESHIFAYPNIWPETSCIAAMEAMSAGCSVVCPNHEALPETLAGFGVMYQMHEDPNVHANRFAAVLDFMVDHWHDESHQEILKFQKVYADNLYNWDNRIKEWTATFDGILRE